MKPHIVVRLVPGLVVPEPPHWSQVIADPTLARRRLHPAVDAVLDRHGVPVLATREYLRDGETWSSDEVAAGFDRIYRLILLDDRRLPPSLVHDIRVRPEVEHAEMGRIGSMPLPTAQSYAGRGSDWARRLIRIPEAHSFTRGDGSVTVAVVDTGIDLRHPELADVLLPGHDFVDIIDGAGEFIGDYLDADADATDQVGHGTHVAGIIAGAGHGMPEGVAPGVRILPVRVLAALRRGTELRGAGLVDNINVGVKWAVDQGADIVNMSLGVRHAGGGLPHREIVEYARRRGVTIVAASGNDGRDEQYYPGAFPYVVTVGAVGADGATAPFSTFGRQVDLVAPGVEIYSASLDRAYAYASGTSHAAPFVAGTVALLKSHAGRLGQPYSDLRCKRSLRATADRPGPRMRDLHQGFGRVNAVDALRHTTYELERPRRR